MLLTKRCMLFADLKTPGAAQQAADMGGGCMLFMLNSEEWTGANSVYLAGWRGTAQLTLFVSKLETQALSHKVLGTAHAADKVGPTLHYGPYISPIIPHPNHPYLPPVPSL